VTTPSASAGHAADTAATSGQDTRYRHVAPALQGRILLTAGRQKQAAAVLDELAAEQHADPNACATPDLAVLLAGLDQPADLLPDRLAPTRWHQAVRAFAARDYLSAAQTYAAIGSTVDQRLALARSTSKPES
jgi:hypothetical protein